MGVSVGGRVHADRWRLESWLEPVADEGVEHVLRLPDIDDARSPTLHRSLDVQDLTGGWRVGEAKFTEDGRTLLLVHGRHLDDVRGCHRFSPCLGSAPCSLLTQGQV